MATSDRVKWCRAEIGGRTIFGLVEADEILEVTGSPFSSFELTDKRHRLGDVKLLLPTVPPVFYAIGVNYADHVRWAHSYFGRSGEGSPREKPHPGYRSPHALVATEQDITIPGDYVGEVHYEAELVCVIGKSASELSEKNALDCVLGYTLGNDLTLREWQKEGRSAHWRVKDSRGTKPMGPWIATGLDPLDLEITVQINGDVVSQFKTSEIMFTPQQLLAVLTRYQTVEPGDVMWTGTQGPTLPPLSDGDLLEVTCPEIGTLRNRVTFGKPVTHPPSGIAAWDEA